MKIDKPINILGISGSLKLTSVNATILRAISNLAPQNVAIKILDSLGELPHFNPELTNEIQSVINFRDQIKLADAVIFSTPEYAFGVPGVLKNALDWLVFSGELNEKPVVAISASPLYSGGDKALASLVLTLTALGTGIDTGSSLSIGNIKNKLNNAGELSDDETIATLKLLLDGLLNRII